jgi:hypothetical protein
MFFSKNHRHKSHATTRHIFRYFFYQSSQKQAELAVKLFDNGIPPLIINVKEPDLSKTRATGVFCLTTALERHRYLQIHLIFQSSHLNLIFNIQSYLIFSDG